MTPQHPYGRVPLEAHASFGVLFHRYGRADIDPQP